MGKSDLSDPNDNDSNFEVLTSQQVHDMMEHEVNKVKEVADIPNALIRRMLGKYKWDVDVFLERFYDENMDVDQVATLKNKKTIGRSTRKQRRLSKSCEICFDDIAAEDVLELTCGHSYCSSCWSSYIEHTINDGSLQSIVCPGCTCLIDDDLIIPYLTSQKQRARYTQIITDSFVTFNRLIKWCGAAGCTMAIKVQTVKESAVKCSCSHSFCFDCGGSAHILISCGMLREFNALRGNALSDAEWLTKHSKPCPRCNVNIEKNGGCNFVTCSKCNLGFCWLCLNPILHEQHNSHPNCTTPDIAKFQAIRTRQLVDCNAKFSAQKESIKFDMNMYRQNLDQTEKIEAGEHWNNVGFLHKAVNALLHARHTLMDSYIFQYLMTTEDNMAAKLSLFEMHQRDLLSRTERLSGFLERQVNGENYDEMKKSVQNYTFFCKRMSEAMAELVTEGYEKDWWKTIETTEPEKKKTKPTQGLPTAK